MKYKIITGANDSYINTTIDFINSLKNISIPIENIIVYDLGFNNVNLQRIKQLLNEDNIKLFNYSKYPEHVNLHNYNGLFCSYAFKPIIIFNEAQQFNKIPIIWLDSACRINNIILNDLINTIHRDGFYCPVGNDKGTIESIELNHPETLKLLGVTQNEHLYELQSRLACICGVFYDNVHGKNILNDWYMCSLYKNIIMPPNSSRNNNRQDQTILSALMMLYEKKTNIIFEKLSFNISCWNKFDKAIVDDQYFSYGLFDKTSNQRLALIYTDSLNNAIKIYYERKCITKDEFLKKFYVLQI